MHYYSLILLTYLLSLHRMLIVKIYITMKLKFVEFKSILLIILAFIISFNFLLSLFKSVYISAYFCSNYQKCFRIYCEFCFCRLLYYFDLLFFLFPFFPFLSFILICFSFQNFTFIRSQWIKVKKRQINFFASKTFQNNPLQ